MPHHRHTRFYDVLDDRQLMISAFDLDCIGACLHQPLNRLHGSGQPLRTGKKWHICNDELIRGTPSNGSRMQFHHFDCGLNRGIKSVHDHGEGIADQQAVDISLVDDFGRPGVVAGDHGDTGFILLLALE